MKNLTVNTQNIVMNVHDFYMKSPLPFALLVIIAIAALASGFLGFKLGDEALKGVSQPEINPSQKISDKPIKTQIKSNKNTIKFNPIDENKVINQVKDYIANREGRKKTPTNPKKVIKENKDQDKNKASKTQIDSDKNQPSNTKSNPKN